MNKVNKLIAGFLFAGMLASLSALAEENAVPQGNEGNGAATEQLKQDRAALKTDKEKLKADLVTLLEAALESPQVPNPVVGSSGDGGHDEQDRDGDRDDGREQLSRPDRAGQLRWLVAVCSGACVIAG